MKYIPPVVTISELLVKLIAIKCPIRGQAGRPASNDPLLYYAHLYVLCKTCPKDDDKWHLRRTNTNKSLCKLDGGNFDDNNIPHPLRLTFRISQRR